MLSLEPLHFHRDLAAGDGHRPNWTVLLTLTSLATSPISILMGLDLDPPIFFKWKFGIPRLVPDRPLFIIRKCLLNSLFLGERLIQVRSFKGFES